MLFSETISELKFNQASDLKMVVNHLKGFTFKEDDVSKIHEFFCLYIFLVGSFKLKKLSCPIKITSRESPDFTISYEKQNKEIGLEHTKATLESFKIAESEAKKYPEVSFIELCYYSPFVKIPKKQSDIGIVIPGDSLKGEGWKGNQVEHEWAEIILNAIKKKIELLNQSHFEVKKENDLFIEDDIPVDFVKHDDDAIRILKQRYNQTNFFEKHIFTKIHIFSNCTLIYDVFGECIKVGLRKKELSNI